MRHIELVSPKVCFQPFLTSFSFLQTVRLKHVQLHGIFLTLIFKSKFTFKVFSKKIWNLTGYCFVTETCFEKGEQQVINTRRSIALQVRIFSPYDKSKIKQQTMSYWPWKKTSYNITFREKFKPIVWRWMTRGI